MSDDPRLAALTALFGGDEFEGVDSETLAKLASEMEWVRIAAGDTLVHEGDAGDDIFFLVAGRLRVFVSRGDEAEAVADIVPGETVGEMELISRTPRSATVCAVRDAQLLRLGRAAFLEAAKRHPQMYASMVRQLVQRLHERNRPRREPGSVTIAIISLTSGLPLQQVAQSVTEALAVFGSAALITSDTEGNPQRSESSPGADVTQWCERREAGQRFTVYLAGPDEEAWIARVAGRADRVLLIAASHCEPVALPSPLGRRRTLAPRFDLALWSENGAVGARRWLDALRPEMHYVLRPGATGDVERLARFLAGQSTGLVLSGGGARGLAHIGAIRALREHGFAIDAIGGTSIGAFMGAHLAAELDLNMATKSAQRVFGGFLRDLTFPAMGVITASRMERTIRQVFGDVLIEDLPIPYYCVTSNLTTAQSHVHKSGPLVEWMVTSMSIPVMIAPFVHQGQLYGDGGTLDNFPVPVMRPITDRVIGVNVSPDADRLMSVKGVWPGRFSGWRTVFSRGSMGKVPTIVDILYRTAVLSSARETKRIRAELQLLIEPPLDQFGLREFGASAKIIEAGYRAASLAIENWARSGVTATGGAH